MISKFIEAAETCTTRDCPVFYTRTIKKRNHEKQKKICDKLSTQLEKLNM